MIVRFTIIDTSSYINGLQARLVLENLVHDNVELSRLVGGLRNWCRQRYQESSHECLIFRLSIQNNDGENFYNFSPRTGFFQ